MGQNIRKAGEDSSGGPQSYNKGNESDRALWGCVPAIGLTRFPSFDYRVSDCYPRATKFKRPEHALEAGQIWSSNTAALTGMVLEAGGFRSIWAHAGDSKEHLIQAFSNAQSLGLDILMTTGGVSVGDYDQVKQALTESGMNMGFLENSHETWKAVAFGHLQ